MTTTPYIRMFQFMTLGAGLGKVGKKANKKTMHKYATEIPLIQMPALPRLNLQGSSCSPFHRLINMQEMEMMYEDNKAQVPRDAIELKATVLPMLIIERPIEKQKETMTELRGMSQPGWTRDKNGPKGTP
jgi:hypothetical protein